MANVIEFSRAVQWIAKFVVESGLPIDSSGALHAAMRTPPEPVGLGWNTVVETETSWGVGCSLSIDITSDMELTLKRPDDDYRYFDLRLAVSWPSMYRSLESARASVALYEKVVDVGCTIRARFEGTFIRCKEETMTHT